MSLFASKSEIGTGDSVRLRAPVPERWAELTGKILLVRGIEPASWEVDAIPARNGMPALKQTVPNTNRAARVAYIREEFWIPLNLLERYPP